MTSVNSNVNRIAQLCNLVSKPELNGVYVTIESYNRARDRYAIRTLVPPTTSPEPVSILVKLSSLEFSAEMYPQATVKDGLEFPDGFPEGIILDYDFKGLAAQVKRIMTGKTLRFHKACRAVGAPAAGVAEVVTEFSCITEIMFHAPDDNAIVEFENIHFTNKVEILNTALAKFKCCRFTGDAKVVRAVGGSRVVFENCLFESADPNAVYVQGNASHGTFLNCTFRNCSLGIRVTDGGSADIIHCTFADCRMAVYGGPVVPLMTMLNCSVTGKTKDVSVMFRDKCQGSIKGCFFKDCGWDAIRIEGPKRSTVLVERCVFTECQYGVHTSTGKVDVTIGSCTFSQILYYGVHLSGNTIGKVDVSGCTYHENRRDVANLCGAHCLVTIDSVLQRQDDVSERHDEIDPELDEASELYGGGKGNVRTALRVYRTHKKAESGCVRCANCSEIEPHGVKYEVCSKCKNVCYCTRECQVTHWRAIHRDECGKVRYG